MPFIPHTEEDIKHMLKTIGVKNIDVLFDEIPASLPKAKLDHFPEGLKESSVARLMMERAPVLDPGSCFIGAGAYEHHIPAAVWEIATRGEFYTAYTPYQAEASQGSLQVIYEYQSMMAHLMGLDVSNASQYDGASALAEAILMTVRIKRGKAKRVVVPKSVHPFYRKVLQTILKYQDISIEELPYGDDGRVDVAQLQATNEDGLAAVVVPQPNFFGVLEEVDALTDIAHQKDALVIALVNPIATALLKEPGAWGKNGADIACGEGQPLGVPLASGGPYFGFLTCKKEHLRQLPGRIVGKTEDASGREGYTLTLQAREQHIRRGKATSNICTNQGLVVTAATIYMSLLGAKGLKHVASAAHQNTDDLLKRLTAIDGVDRVFSGPVFHEFVLRLNRSVDDVLVELAKVGIQGGYSLKTEYPELGESLLVCVTETKNENDLNRYQDALEKLC
ncbi:MAG: aminomethyl-transferring glycine dehydrogenase subunit GcvPA [Coxiellaceae bacterium]|nr:aminomethyl-transferring glycine dehydrogenase subunit GcvPA [Coxiellaceae bacterium]